LKQINSLEIKLAPRRDYGGGGRASLNWLPRLTAKPTLAAIAAIGRF